MEIQTLRETINRIDDQLVELFLQRMDTAQHIAEYKKEHGLPVLDKGRERDILNHVCDKAGSEMEVYTRILFSTLFDVSRSYQNRQMLEASPLEQEIRGALLPLETLFPERAVVACQGVEGSYGQQACEKLFKLPNILYFSQFDGVFQAVEQGMCQYGLLPIENSTAGSVTTVYDLMKKHKFHIVRSVKLRVNHALLVKNGVSFGDITEVVSHEQAISQCGEFLRSRPDVKVTVFPNTAAAAKYVAESDRKDLAAISSKVCAELYGLNVLQDAIQDSGNNYTRFICISKGMEIYPGANKISLMIPVPHRPGSLSSMIARFSALGINLSKLESRPIPGKDFEFMFYFDMEASVHNPRELALLCELQQTLDNFVFLGNYSEVS